MTLVAAVGSLCVGIIGLFATEAPGLSGFMFFYVWCALVIALLCLAILWKGAER